MPDSRLETLLLSETGHAQSNTSPFAKGAGILYVANCYEDRSAAVSATMKRNLDQISKTNLDSWYIVHNPLERSSTMLSHIHADGFDMVCLYDIRVSLHMVRAVARGGRQVAEGVSFCLVLHYFAPKSSEAAPTSRGYLSI